MKVVSVVGARPQFVKIAPIAQAIAADHLGSDAQHLIIHTGQHYDAKMSDVFFSELNLPVANINLGIGSGSHGTQTGAMMAALESSIREVNPDIVIVYGDTNSTLAAALTAVKLHIPVAHVEAGLRSFNRRMPEEINRVVADHVCDLLLAPTPTAMANLNVEGLAKRARFTGDVMYDAVLFFRDVARKRSAPLPNLMLAPHAYAVATLHRAENTDNPVLLRTLLDTFNEIAANQLPIVFPVHPRTSRQIREQLPDWQPNTNLRMVEPLGYLDMIALVDRAALTLTDSGGLQKEAFFLGCPCVTLRDETEWLETVTRGANELASGDPVRVLAAVEKFRHRYPNGKADFSDSIGVSFGDGRAAEIICQAIAQFMSSDRNTASSQSGNKQYTNVKKVRT